jgi:hypothetical protein
VFVSDHDFPGTDPLSECTFSGVRLYEAPDDAVLSLDVDGRPGRPVTRYGGAGENDLSARAEIGSSGYALTLAGNTWRKAEFWQPVRLTAQTIIEFTFSSSAQGQIHGIGFDNDDTITDGDRQNFLQVYGSEAWGRRVNNYYNPPQPGGSVLYRIRLGDVFGANFEGTFQYITFANDHDITLPTAASRYHDINFSLDGGRMNHAPTASGDSYTTVQDENLHVGAGRGLLSNDRDLDNQPPSNAGLSLVVPPQVGPARPRFQETRGGGFIYTPPADWTGVETFSYRVMDAEGKVAGGHRHHRRRATRGLPGDRQGERRY